MPRKRLLIKGLLAAVGIAQGTPPIFSGRQRTLKQRLEHKTNIYGMLVTDRLDVKTLEEVRHALEALPTDLVTPGEVKNIIIDSGCSKTVTGFEDDFMDLQPLEHHLIMEGIEGQLHDTHKGTVRNEVIDSREEVAELKTSALYIPGLKCRLLSPQF